jgi:hypothetical protein
MAVRNAKFEMRNGRGRAAAAPGLLLLLALAVAAAGCGDPEAPEAGKRTVYEDVRGRFLGTASDGRDAVVHHEAIPDVMDAMVMAVPLADTSAAAGLARGRPVAFDLVIDGASLRLENLTPLADTTTLALPERREEGPRGEESSGE